MEPGKAQGSGWALSHPPSRACWSRCPPPPIPPASPSSAGIIGELEQMAAEPPGKRENLSGSCCAVCSPLRVTAPGTAGHRRGWGSHSSPKTPPDGGRGLGEVTGTRWVTPGVPKAAAAPQGTRCPFFLSSLCPPGVASGLIPAGFRGTQFRGTQFRI